MRSGDGTLQHSFADDDASVLSNDQRPANSILARFVLRRHFPSFGPEVGRLFDGTSTARNPSKLSDVTKPSAASSESASSTCDGSKPVRRTNSVKNNAPPTASASRTPCVADESSIVDLAGARQSQSSRFSR